MFEALVEAGATFASSGPGQLVILLGLDCEQTCVEDGPDPVVTDPHPLPPGGEEPQPGAPPGVRREITASDVVDAALRLPAGANASALLTSVTGLELTDFDEVQLLKGWARQRAHTEARVLQTAVPAAEHPLAASFGSQEVAAALTVSVTAADRMLTLARHLDGVLPHTRAALTEGSIDLPAARTIAEATYPLDPDDARAVEARVLPRAARILPASLRDATARAVMAVAPDVAERRNAERLAEVDVGIMTLDDGMAGITGTLPLAEAAIVGRALDDWADRHAPCLPGATRGQRRGAALVAWARQSLAEPGGPRRHGQPARDQIGLVIDLPTLAGLAEHPGWVPGYGPVPAAAARAFAAGGELHRMVTDPVTGHLLDYGRARHDPPQELVDYLLARDTESAFPTSRLSSHRCDLDHQIPYPQGPTAARNVAPNDRRGHNAHTHAGWTPHRQADGTTSWTSPRGHTYRHQPTDYRLGP